MPGSTSNLTGGSTATFSPKTNTPTTMVKINYGFEKRRKEMEKKRKKEEKKRAKAEGKKSDATESQNVETSESGTSEIGTQES